MLPLALTALYADAQSTSPTASTVLSSTITALGTSAPVLQGTTAQGTFSENGETGNIVIKTSGQLVRYEVSLPSQQFISVFQGGQAYTVQNGQSRSIPAWIAKYHRALHMPLVSRLADASLSNAHLEYIGTEPVNATSAYHVRLWSSPIDSTPSDLEQRISEFHALVDAKTYLPAKFITYDLDPRAMENRSEVDVYLSDYRNVNGAMIPFRITSYSNGEMQSDIVLTSVATGVTQSPTDFQ
jgi:hypothetical protein